jgi:serine/threonine-protein kinase
VVASCEAAGVYLLTWSPAQGYAASQVVRGPAAVASVDFESTTQEVTMQVTCHGGIPAATTSVDNSGGGHGE